RHKRAGRAVDETAGAGGGERTGGESTGGESTGGARVWAGSMRAERPGTRAGSSLPPGAACG
ncbi:hypothetical protein, partial [Methylobacterium sp. WL93]|uniref:hypothetical protein n=1 Tax=Methylobacterium sp. WL93 TaxID=2603892 RepID=UPI001AEF28DB